MKSKRTLKAFVIIFTLFLPPTLTFPQNESATKGSTQKYRKGKIIKSDNTVQRVRNIFWDSQTLTCVDEKTGWTVTLPLSEVNRVVKVGNYCVEGAIAGGVATLCLGLLNLLKIEADPLYESKENAGTIIAGLTLGGALAVALIGSNVAKEKTVYSKGAVRAQISLLPRFVNSGGKSIEISFLTAKFLF